MIKRIFSVFMAAAIISVLLPVSVLAAQKQLEDLDGDDFIVRGTPSSDLPLGTYRIEVVKGLSNESTYHLKIHYPSNSDKDPVTLEDTLNDSMESITWDGSGLTISRMSNNSSWHLNDSGFFNISDKSSSNTTTITSSNIKLIDFTKRDIDRGTQIKPQFEVIDYNIDASRGVLPGSPTITGFPSNESFVLNGEESISVVNDPASEKVTLRITLPLRYTGEGNSLSFTVAYKTLDGAERLLDCITTIPYTIEKRDEYLYDDDEDEEQDDLPTPYIIVDSYDYGGSSVTAGEDFERALRLRNTSSDHTLENIVMNISPMGVFSMSSSSNTFYINRLAAGSIMEKVITINTGLTKVTDDEDANSINIKFTYQYGIKENDIVKLHSGNSSESITLPVDFPDRFELGVPEYNSRVFAGEEIYLTVPMVNKGRSSVYNLSASVRGEMANPGQTQYIGNLSAGTESSADFSIIFDEPGTYSGEVVVTYEDTNMNPKEVISQFSVTVQQMDFDRPAMDMPMMPEEPAVEVDAQPKSDPTKPIKIVLALLVGSMSAYTTVAKAKAKRSIYLDEDI